MDAVDIRANLNNVEERIVGACQRAGRSRGTVRLLLATKTVAPERIRVAIEAGATLVGENKVQELVEKADALSDLAYERHFISHLQSNKINQVLRYVSCIHSIDSIALAQKLNRRLQEENRALDVFVQVNTSYEASKFGVPPEETERLVREIASLERLNVRGLMTIGLLFSQGEKARQCFVRLRELRDHIAEQGIDRVEMTHLSMGMSPDFEEAIQEGATS